MGLYWYVGAVLARCPCLTPTVTRTGESRTQTQVYQVHWVEVIYQHLYHSATDAACLFITYIFVILFFLLSYGLGVWLGGVEAGCRTCDHVFGHGFESQLPHCRVQPGQLVNTHVPLSPSSIIWYQTVMPCSWEGNHMSSVALATRHRH